MFDKASYPLLSREIHIYDAVFNYDMKRAKEICQLIIDSKIKIKIAVVTNLTTHIQLRKIKRLGLTKYVDYFVSSY